MRGGGAGGGRPGPSPPRPGRGAPRGGVRGRGGVHRPGHQRAAEAESALAAGQQVGQGSFAAVGHARTTSAVSTSSSPVARAAAAVDSSRPRGRRAGGHRPRRPAPRRRPAVGAERAARSAGPVTDAGAVPAAAGLPSAAVINSSRTAGATALSARSRISSAASPGVSGPRRRRAGPPVRRAGGGGGRPSAGRRAYGRLPYACGGAGERGAGRGVPAVGVVHAEEERAAVRKESSSSCAPRADVPYRAGAEEAGGVVEERGAAATGFTGHDTDAAVGAQRVQQLGGQPRRGRVRSFQRPYSRVRSRGRYTSVTG